eukprot:scaffold21633_cov51-Cyclotella_meneghiniana.AAC.2
MARRNTAKGTEERHRREQSWSTEMMFERGAGCALKFRNSEGIRSLDLHPQIEPLAERLETQEPGNNSSWVSSEGR